MHDAQFVVFPDVLPEIGAACDGVVVEVVEGGEWEVAFLGDERFEAVELCGLRVGMAPEEAGGWEGFGVC